MSAPHEVGRLVAVAQNARIAGSLDVSRSGLSLPGSSARQVGQRERRAKAEGVLPGPEPGDVAYRDHPPFHETDMEPTKSAGISEESLRRGVRNAAKTEFQETELLLSAELIGIACQVTRIEDPAAALQELVDDALHRWARLQMLERRHERPDPQPLRKGVGGTPVRKGIGETPVIKD